MASQLAVTLRIAAMGIMTEMGFAAYNQHHHRLASRMDKRQAVTTRAVTRIPMEMANAALRAARPQAPTWEPVVVATSYAAMVPGDQSCPTAAPAITAAALPERERCK